MEYYLPLVSKKKKEDWDIGNLVTVDIYLREILFVKLYSLSENQFPYKKRLGKDSISIYSLNSDMKIKFLKSNKNEINIRFEDNKKRNDLSKKELSYKRRKYSKLVIRG